MGGRKETNSAPPWISYTKKTKLPKLTFIVVLFCLGIKHAGCVNRIKYNRIGPTPVAAAWAENGTVAVWNLSNVMARLDQPSKEVK